jgi:hypothetical protein
MKFWAINKKTKLGYGPYTAEEVDYMESHPLGRYFDFVADESLLDVPHGAIKTEQHGNSGEPGHNPGANGVNPRATKRKV